MTAKLRELLDALTTGWTGVIYNLVWSVGLVGLVVLSWPSLSAAFVAFCCGFSFATALAIALITREREAATAAHAAMLQRLQDDPEFRISAARMADVFFGRTEPPTQSLH